LANLYVQDKANFVFGILHVEIATKEMAICF